MKGGSNITSAVHHLKMALEHFDSFRREHPGTKGERLFKMYGEKITWVVRDMITHTALSEPVRNGVKQEWESDVFSVPAINEKVSLLNPVQREFVETIMDKFLSGEKIFIDVQSQ